MGIGGGYSVTKHKAVAEFQLGLHARGWIIQAGALAHADHVNAALLQLKTGARIILHRRKYPDGLQLTAGYCRQLVSSDQKSLNKNASISTGEYFWTGHWGECSLSASYSTPYFITSIVFRGFFQRKKTL
jgi:hypothetical protein